MCIIIFLYIDSDAFLNLLTENKMEIFNSEAVLPPDLVSLLISIHTYVCTWLHACVLVYSSLNTCHIHTCTYIHVFIYVYICICVCVTRNSPFTNVIGIEYTLSHQYTNF